MEANVPAALATAADFTIRYPSLCQSGPASDISTLSDMMIEATAEIESMCSRRLAPFVNIVESHPLYGIDPAEYGTDVAGMPLPFAGSLGMSFAASIGVQDLVRKLWLREYAPRYSELWTYSLTSVEIVLSIGGAAIPAVSAIQGPYPDSGMMRLQLGTFAPEGSTAVVTYSGGYPYPPPGDLKRACLLQTVKDVIIDMEPQSRAGFNLDELDVAITKLIANWVR